MRQRGHHEDQVDGLIREAKDILIASGPHLGDFNRQISLPELIESVSAMSAVCIAGRFLATLKPTARTAIHTCQVTPSSKPLVTKLPPTDLMVSKKNP